MGGPVPPVLSSDLLSLRPLAQAERELVYRLYGDGRITGGYGMAPLRGSALEDKLQQLTGAWAAAGFSQFVITEQATGGQAGLGGIRATSEPAEGEIGYVLLPDFWGRGIASEAIRLWTAWGLGDLGLGRIVADGVENPASVRALEKNGYRTYHQERRGEKELFSLEIFSP